MNKVETTTSAVSSIRPTTDLCHLNPSNYGHLSYVVHGCKAHSYLTSCNRPVLCIPIPKEVSNSRHNRSFDSCEYLLGLALDFLNVLVPTEAHGEFKLRKDRLYNVFHSIGSPES